jgi:hypothetical protein
MDEYARAIFNEASTALANPGAQGKRKLAQLADATVERRPDPEPAPVELSAEDREIAFLLAYRGNDAGLLWRKWHAEQQVRQRADAERRAAEARERLALTDAANIDNRIEAKFTAHDEVWRQVHGAVIAQERKLWRAEIAKAHADADHGAVVDLPALELRSQRRA